MTSSPIRTCAFEIDGRSLLVQFSETGMFPEVAYEEADVIATSEFNGPGGFRLVDVSCLTPNQRAIVLGLTHAHQQLAGQV